MAAPSIKQCNIALKSGDADKALELAIALLQRNKNDIEALTVCYQAYRQKNDSQNAIKVLEVILGIEPGADWASTNLGQLYFTAGKIDCAEATLRRAIEVNPRNAAAHAFIGVVFSELNRLSAGEWHFRRALQIGGPDCDIFTNLALNLTQQEKGDEADSLYAQAHELEPRNIRTLAYWAKLQEVRGEFTGAINLLDKAEEIQPGSVDLLRATLQSRTGNDEQALDTIGAAKKLNGDALLERGHLKDRMGDYDGAWNDFVEAKRLLAGDKLRYDAQAVEKFFDNLKATFDGELMSELPRSSPSSGVAQPIFVVGAPRSGTTLVERILSAHSAIEAGGELPFIADLRVLSEKLLAGAGFPQNIAAMRVADQRHVATLFRDYYLAHRNERLCPSNAVAFVTDKMPFNEMYLPLIRMAFPLCPIVHLSRHRLDTAVSMLSNKLNHGFHCAYRIDDIMHHLNAVSTLHQHYRQQIDTQEYRLSYETLVENPEVEVRGLLEHIGLPFEEGCLNFHEGRGFIATPSYRQVDEKISDRSVGRHKNYLQHLERFIT